MNASKMNNALNVYYINNIKQDQSIDLIRIKAFVPAGNLVETENNIGISHLIEHVLLDSWSRKNYWKNKGVYTNGHTNNNLVIYDIAGPKKYEKEMFDYIHDILTNPNITSSVIKKSKKSVKEELLNYLENPIWSLYDTLYKNIYKNDNKFIGDIQKKLNILDTFTKNDIENFIKTNYKNIVVIVHGSTNHMHGSTHTNRQEPSVLRHLFSKNAIVKFISGSAIYREVPIKSINKTHFLIVYKCNPTNYMNKVIYQPLISDILCGSLDSLLYSKLRLTHGLIYEISIRFDYDAINNMLLTIFEFSCSEKSSEKALHIFLSTMQNFIKNGSGMNEKSKEKLLLFDNDLCKNSSFACDFYGRQLVLFGKYDEYDSCLQKIKNISKKQFQEVVQEFFKDLIIIRSIRA